MKRTPSALRATGAIAPFFAAKVLSGLLILKLSALWLPVAGFTQFSQFLLFGALLTTLAVGGAQHGIVRQVAAGDRAATGRIMTAAFGLWLLTCALVLPIALVFAADIVEGLTGRVSDAWAVPIVAIAALASGPTQIGWSILSGQGRVGSSIAAQAVGLLGGTAAAIILLSQGRAVEGAIAYAAGSLISLPATLVALWRPGLHFARLSRHVVGEALALLRFSGAFAAVAALTALTMFALRYVYLQVFDAEALGYWMVAQRISDTSTQLLGLFMIQYVVPGYAPCPDDRRPTFLRHAWLIGTGAMALLLAVFALAPEVWIPLFLAEKYLPASLMILLYMTGDVARATASLAMHASLARGWVVRYVLVEACAIALMVAITLVLIATGRPLAPAIGYAGAYALVALFLLLFWAWGRSWRVSAARAAPPS